MNSCKITNLSSEEERFIRGPNGLAFDTLTEKRLNARNESIEKGIRIYGWDITNLLDLRELEDFLEENSVNIENTVFNLYPGCTGGILLRFLDTTDKDNHKLLFVGLRTWKFVRNILGDEVPETNNGEINIKEPKLERIILRVAKIVHHLTGIKYQNYEPNDKKFTTFLLEEKIKNYEN